MSKAASLYLKRPWNLIEFSLNVALTKTSTPPQNLMPDNNCLQTKTVCIHRSVWSGDSLNFSVGQSWLKSGPQAAKNIRKCWTCKNRSKTIKNATLGNYKKFSKEHKKCILWKMYRYIYIHIYIHVFCVRVASITWVLVETMNQPWWRFYLDVYLQIAYFPQTKIYVWYIWVNFNISLTWNVGPFWDDSPY